MEAAARKHAVARVLDTAPVGRRRLGVWALAASGIGLDGYDLFIMSVAGPLIVADLGLSSWQDSVAVGAAVQALQSFLRLRMRTIAAPRSIPRTALAPRHPFPVLLTRLIVLLLLAHVTFSHRCYTHDVTITSVRFEARATG